MIDLTETSHHPALEEIVDVLCKKTQNTDRGFFRAEVAYFLAKMASNMRAIIVTKDRGEIPVNMYTLALAGSGFGKGHSVHVMENEFIKGFRKVFMEETMPVLAEANMWDMAKDKAMRTGDDEQDEMDRLLKQYSKGGVFAFTFDSGTPAALKQLRHTLQLAGCGSLNLQVDEIGSNLIGSTDMLNVYLELYDQGQVKQKITKNTAENERAEELDGKTPTNALLFGTPVKLLDGGPTEEQFYSFLDTGYARRCLFGIGHQDRKAFHSQTPEEIYRQLIDSNNINSVNKWADHFANLAHASKFAFKIIVNDEVAIALLKYKIDCERDSELLPEHMEVQKAELSHRYFKALKLAGAYAFVDETTEMTLEQLNQAIKLVEESGVAFAGILNRESSYMKLARYIASIGDSVTHADLHEALPYYKSSAAARNELMNMAMSWGYKKHIIIKKSFVDGIEFFDGETLEETNIDQIMVIYSNHYAYDYQHELVPFSEINVLTQQPAMHWTNHNFKNGHRSEENVIAGFNMIVLDVDGTISLEAAHELLSEYKFMTYTTKRHTEEENRFRLLLPMNYVLDLDADEYKEFMQNVVNWLPFKVDEEANQRSRKWSTFDGGTFHYNMEGAMINVLPFIPRTTKNAEYKEGFKEVASHDNLERWFAQRIASGNRNNQMLKYALALVDSGLDLMEVNKRVHSFNTKLNNALTENEIDTTIMTTVAKRYQRS